MSTKSVIPSLLLALAAAAGAHDIEVTSSGQTVGWRSPVDAAKPVTIAVSADTGLDQLEVRYRPVAGVTNPVLLTEGDLPAEKSVSGRALFTVPAPTTGFTIYNIWQKTKTGATEAEKTAAKAKLAELDARIPQLQKTVDENPAQKKINQLQAERDSLSTAADHTAEIARLKTQITDLDKELDSYSKIPVARSVDAIREVESELRPLRRQLAELQEQDSTPDPRLVAIDKQIAALQSTPDLTAATEALQEANNQHKLQGDIVGSTNEYTVLKIGLIVAGSTHKGIYYNLAGTPQDNTLQLQAVGDVPLLVDGDLIYLLIGRKHSAPVGAFSLSVTIDPGTTIDSTPVRPSSTVTLESGERRFTTTDTYEDVVLPFVRPARGNNILKMTVKTDAMIVSVDKTEIVDKVVKQTQTTEKMEIELLKDAALPQVHPLYRFNVTTGLAYSGLRQPEFEKVQTALDDPSTTNTNEARYRIDTRRGNRKIRPLLALTTYWKPNDPLQPLTLKERLTPNFTVALGFTDPTENIFLGFSNELWRGVEVIWGIHRGQIDVINTRPDAIEEQQSTLPTAYKVAKQKFFVGITLNLNFLTKLIKLPAAS